MPLYYVASKYGASLVQAKNPQQAKAYMRREYGRAGEPYQMTRNPDDIAWAKALGAMIHEAGDEQEDSHD